MNSKNVSRLTVVVLICAGAAAIWLSNRSGHRSALQRSAAAAPLANQAQASTIARTHAAAPQSPERFQVVTDPDAAPSWAVKYGGEFWRHHSVAVAQPADTGKASTLINPPFSLGDVVERVDHALAIDPATGFPQITAANYTARFDGEGVEFSPAKPAIRPAGGGAAASADSEEGSSSQSGQSAYGPAVLDPATQILFQTASVERDGQDFFSADQNPIQWTVTGNTVQGLLSQSSGIVEHYEATSDGVEVAWVFTQLLPGAGAVDITATVDGLKYAGQNDLGLHFADNSGVARVYVGQAQAVDSLGNRWNLTTYPVAGSTDKLVVEVPAQVQEEAVYPLAIDPIVGAEFGMNNPVSTAAAGNQQNAAIASGAGMFFVAWSDDRNRTNTSRDIYGTRVSNAGKILDPFGVCVCTTGSSQSTPAVAASGSTFLVTWQDGRLGGQDIFGARVGSVSGTLLDPLGFAISFDTAQNPKTNSSVAGGPSGFFAVWEDNRNSGFAGSQIFGARVSTAGIVMDPAGIGVSTNTANQFHPTVVCNNSNFFVAWEDDRSNGITGKDIYGGRVDTNGIVLDPTGVPLCTVSNNQQTPVAAINDDTVLVTWRDRRRNATRTNDIFGTRVNFTNNTVNVLDPLGIAISTNGLSQTPAVCALTNGFLVVWADSRNNGTTGTDIYGTRVDTNASVLDTNGFAICTNAGNQVNPAVAANPPCALAVWTDPINSPDTGNDILGTRISILGTLLDTNALVVSRSGAQQSSPSVAFNGTNYLVVWQDERNYISNSTDILGTRVSATGTVLDPHGINVCVQPAAQQHPSVGASGGEFFVAWEDSRNAVDGVDIYGTRVSGSGAVLDGAGLPLSLAPSDQLAPSVAGNDSDFLVAWEDNSNPTNASGIYGTIISQGGVVFNPTGEAIATTTGNGIGPSVAANPNQFLVAFEDDGPVDVFAVRVGNNGAVLDGTPLGLASNGAEVSPAAASLGTNYLVAWADSRRGSLGSDIYAGRVMGDGTTPDANNNGIPICTFPNDQINPAVGADTNTSTYVVVWQNVGPTDGNDIYSARVGTNGTVLDFWTEPLMGTADRFSPQLAFGGAGKFLLVSDAFRPTNSPVVVGSLTTGSPSLVNSTVQFSAPTYSVAVSGKFATVSVTVSGKYTGEVTVDFATADGTAIAGTDYMPVAGRLVFSAKKTSATVLVPIIDTGAGPPNKTVNLTLQNPMGGVLIGAQPTATLTILE